jgi:hypothetical protein
MLKSIFSAAAMALTFALIYPYIRSILRGHTKPHVLSWAIWGVGTLVVFIAQLADGAGIGAWPIGLSGLITIYIAILSWTKRSDLSVTPLDWSCLVVALSAIPIWLVTSSPLWAVLILTAVDMVGFGPTVRKAYSKPHEERMWFYLLGGLRNVLVILALERYSPTTVVFPAAVGIACIALAAFIELRRRTLNVTQTSRAV